MPSVIIRLRVFVAHDRFGGERFVAAFPRDRVRDLVTRLLVEAGIEDDPRDWELYDGGGGLHPNRTVNEVLAHEPPRDGWSLRRAASVRPARAAAPAPQPAPPPAPPPPPTGPVTHFTDALLAKQVISPEQLADAERHADNTGIKLQDAIVKLNYATAAEVMRAVAERYGLAFVDLSELDIPKAVIELVPESVARENVVLPLALDGNTLTVATSDPADSDTLEKLQFILNKTILPVLATREQIMETINRYYGDAETESVDSMLVEFTDTAIEFTRTEAPPNPTAAPGAAPPAPASAAPADEDEDFADEDLDDADEDDEAPAARADRAPPPSVRAKRKASARGEEGGKTRQRRATVRYYSRMNPERVFPLLVMLTRQEVERVVKRHVEQKATGPLELDKDTPIEIEPVLPGCQVYPQKVVTRLAAADQAFTFHVVPHVVGDVTGARVFVRQDHAVLAEIELDVRVVQRTWVMVSGLSTVLLPVGSAAMRHFGLDFSPKGSDPYLALLDFLFGRVSPVLLMAVLAVVTGVAWWLTRPKGRDVFWDISTKPAG